jgi:hypothetical protein
VAPQLASRAPAVALLRLLPQRSIRLRPHLAWLLARGRLPFFSRGVNPCAGVVFRCTGRTMRPQTLPVALPLRGSRVRRAGTIGPRTLSTDDTPMSSLPRPEAPSTDGSLTPRPLLALRTRLHGRHWSLGLAALVQLPTRVRPYRYELGLAPEPVIHRSWRGHVPPIDFCRVWTPEHDHRCPNPNRLFDATVELPRDRVTTPEGAANRAFSAQG